MIEQTTAVELCVTVPGLAVVGREQAEVHQHQELEDEEDHHGLQHPGVQ